MSQITPTAIATEVDLSHMVPASDWRDMFPQNRLGTLVHENEFYGQIMHYEWPAGGRQGPNRAAAGYFVWRLRADGESQAGEFFPTYEEAMNSLGFRKPTGCSDWEGNVRLGRMIERGTLGAIYKVSPTEYYVWPNDSSLACDCPNLTRARERAGVNIAPPEKLTPPKSSYAQNRAGYKASSGK